MMELKPAKWLVELILIANELGREAYLDNDRIRNILSPAIQTICRLKPEDSIFFPPLLQPRHITSYTTRASPTRPLPYRPATGYTTTHTGPQTPLQGLGTDPSHRAEISGTTPDIPYSQETPPREYASSQRLPELNSALPPLTWTAIILPPSKEGSPPVPHPWTPKFIP